MVFAKFLEYTVCVMETRGYLKFHHHTLIRSFKYAFNGLSIALEREPNLRIHFTIASIVLIVAALLKLALWEWLFLTFTIFYVITLELLNTVLEAIVNLVSPEIREYAKIAKDVSAACVLFAAFMAVIVGSFLILPKILRLL